MRLNVTLLKSGGSHKFKVGVFLDNHTFRVLLSSRLRNPNFIAQFYKRTVSTVSIGANPGAQFLNDHEDPRPTAAVFEYQLKSTPTILGILRQHISFSREQRSLVLKFIKALPNNIKGYHFAAPSTPEDLGDGGVLYADAQRAVPSNPKELYSIPGIERELLVVLKRALTNDPPEFDKIP